MSHTLFLCASFKKKIVSYSITEITHKISWEKNGHETTPLNQCFGFTLEIGGVGREGIDTIYIKFKLPWYLGDISGFKLVFYKDFMSQNLFEIISRSPRAHRTLGAHWSSLCECGLP